MLVKLKHVNLFIPAANTSPPTLFQPQVGKLCTAPEFETQFETTKTFSCDFPLTALHVFAPAAFHIVVTRVSKKSLMSLSQIQASGTPHCPQINVFPPPAHNWTILWTLNSMVNAFDPGREPLLFGT